VVAQSVPLICHPATPCEAVSSINVQALRRRDAALEILYTVQGRVDRLLIPAQSPPRRADRLWQHTCFEAFVANPASGRDASYFEFNFSPSSEWAIYRFSAYREGMTPLEAAPPSISVRRGATSVTLEAVVDLDAVSALADGLRLALSAVIEDAEHRLSYWALAHPRGKPDFHHAAGFALELPAGAERRPHPNPPPQAGEGKLSLDPNRPSLAGEGEPSPNPNPRPLAAEGKPTPDSNPPPLAGEGKGGGKESP